MASQTQIAGAGASNNAIGVIPWATPGNITADDGTNATAAGMNNNEISEYLVSSSHGFSIPAGSTIDGIVVEVDRHQGAAQQMQDHRVRIVKGGVVGSTDKSAAGAWETTPTTVSYGSSTDLWGESWTVSDINASNFGVAFASTQTNATSVQARVDFIRVTVHYTAGGSPQNVPITNAAVTNTAQPLSFVKPILKTLGVVSVTSTAQALTFTKPIRKTLTVATVTDTAQPLSVSGPHQVVLTPAVVTATAQALSVTHVHYRTVTAATETDAATSLTLAGLVTRGDCTVSDAAVTLVVLTDAPVTALTLSEAGVTTLTLMDA